MTTRTENGLSVTIGRTHEEAVDRREHLLHPALLFVVPFRRFHVHLSFWLFLPKWGVMK